MSVELRCLVCYHTLSTSEHLSSTDQQCQAQNQTYHDLIKHILGPVNFDESNGAYHMCRECQVLADEFNYHQIQMVSIKSFLSSRYTNSFKSAETVCEEELETSMGIDEAKENDQPVSVGAWLNTLLAAEERSQDGGSPKIQILEMTSSTILRKRGRRKLGEPKTLFRCQDCGYVCRDKTRLREHSAVHSEGQRVWTACKECGKKFRSQSGLRYHLTVHRGIKAYTCPLCPARFRTNQQVKSHMRTRHKEEEAEEGSPQTPGSSLRVQDGTKEARAEDALTRQRGGGLPRCRLCRMTFIDSATLQKHLQTHKANKEYRCEECGKTFSSRSNLETHMVVHDEMRPVFICTECGKEFRTRTGLLYHEKVHMGLRPISCPICPARFRVKSHLKTHMKVHSSRNETTREPLRSKRKQMEESLASDAEEVEDSQTEQDQEEDWEAEQGGGSAREELSCDLCDQTFVHPANLQKHLLKHGDGKMDLKCDVCGKVCRRQSELQAHMAVHTDDRPFACSECGKTFRSLSGLKYHEKMHTGDYPFECSQCTAVFRSKSNMKKHVNTVHREGRPLLASGRVPGRSPTRRGSEAEAVIVLNLDEADESPPPSPVVEFEQTGDDLLETVLEDSSGF